jgi:DNA-binding HxlR family transcriptional regulator
MEFDVFNPACPSRVVLEHVTSKWGVLVLGTLREGPRRFSELARSCPGISDRMLSATLKELVGDGLVRRAAQPEQSRVVYALTQAGENIAAATSDLAAAVQGAMPALIKQA